MYSVKQLCDALFTYLHQVKRKISYEDAVSHIDYMIKKNGYSYTVDLLKDRYPNIDFYKCKHLISDTQYDRCEQLAFFDHLPEVVRPNEKC